MTIPSNERSGCGAICVCPERYTEGPAAQPIRRALQDSPAVGWDIYFRCGGRGRIVYCGPLIGCSLGLITGGADGCAQAPRLAAKVTGCVVSSGGEGCVTVHILMTNWPRLYRHVTGQPWGNGVIRGFSLTPASLPKHTLGSDYDITMHQVTDQEVIFWNYLKFGGSSAPGMDSPQLNARLECRYPVNERPILLPSLPLTGALAADGNLIFSMKMMTGDWTAERPDSLFFLGASINLEASVLATYHQPLRLYLKECIATPTRSLAKSPENYTIINNYGCLVDGKTGNSKYLPRSDGSVLRFVIQAFKFISQEDADIFIHCSAFVWDPSWDGLLHKACSFDQQTQSWKLLDAPLQSSLCDCCNTTCQPIQSRHKRHTENQSIVLLATPMLACLLGLGLLFLYRWKIRHVHHNK
ncbi:zona pellucida sperm-binding protein 3-like isoform X1 [Narcine bancroftii]|uniref:zona pellucida sperm-binding protein 3-like isoform X1 n=1 Tax=Narcine bancroftii TaxID=1343680 RepID=UPI003831C4FE